MKKRRIFISGFSFIILGIMNALTEKFLYEQEAEGSRGKHKFMKPIFFSTTLFFGVSLSLVVYVFLSLTKKSGYPPLSKLRNGTFFQFIIPGFFDLFQGVMSSITSALIGVSIDYMLRSATLVGVSIIARFYFKRQFKQCEVSGILIVTVSLFLVGLSSVINADISSTVHVSRKWAIIIIILKLISQTTYSIELSLDQYYTQQKRIHCMIVSGFQSFWAFLIGALILIPISNIMPGEEGNGLHEDIKDTFLMLKNNKEIVVIISMSVLIESIYQMSSVTLTELTSAVIRTLVESFRTFLLWIIQLAIFYGFKKHPTLQKYRGIGEEWSKGSWLQLFGYLLLLFGLLTYRGFKLNKIRRNKNRLELTNQDYVMLDSELSLSI